MNAALLPGLALLLATAPLAAQTKLSASSEEAYKASITAMSSELTQADLQYVIRHVHDLILLRIEAKDRLTRAQSIERLGKEPQLFWEGLKRFDGMTAREIVAQKP